MDVFDTVLHGVKTAKKNLEKNVDELRQQHSKRVNAFVQQVVYNDVDLTTFLANEVSQTFQTFGGGSSSSNNNNAGALSSDLQNYIDASNVKWNQSQQFFLKKV